MLALIESWLLLWGGLTAQQQQPDFRLVSEVRLVLLDVAVRDASGRPVPGLAKENFRVFDSGRVQPLAAFAKEDAPVTIALLVDASGSMKRRRADVVSAASVFAEESNPGDEVFAVLFNDEVIVGPVAPAGELRGAIAAAEMEGRTALYDALAASLKRVAQGAQERKALVLISDGGDTASRLRRDDILREALLSHATIYAIGIADESQGDRDPGFLREIARLSGGEAHLDVPAAELPGLCRAIAREIRARYVLGFHAAEARKEEKRPIRVQVRVPGTQHVRALSRRSYIATPARAAP